jgi:predicted nucleic acid-binding protein
MVLDSSVIVAIHLKEPGHERLLEVIDEAIEKADVFIGGPYRA